jgi:Aminotransferase class-III
MSFPSHLLPFVLTMFWRRIVVPEPGYLAKVHELCKKHNVLLICDEIQTVRATFPIPCPCPTIDALYVGFVSDRQDA